MDSKTKHYICLGFSTYHDDNPTELVHGIEDRLSGALEKAGWEEDPSCANSVGFTYMRRCVAVGDIDNLELVEGSVFGDTSQFVTRAELQAAIQKDLPVTIQERLGKAVDQVWALEAKRLDAVEEKVKNIAPGAIVAMARRIQKLENVNEGPRGSQTVKDNADQITALVKLVHTLSCGQDELKRALEDATAEKVRLEHIMSRMDTQLQVLREAAHKKGGTGAVIAEAFPAAEWTLTINGGIKQ